MVKFNSRFADQLCAAYNLRYTSRLELIYEIFRLDKLGGSIFLRSFPGKGTIVLLVIPVAFDTSEQNDTIKTTPGINRQPIKRALVVDDNSINIKVLCALLKKLDIESSFAENGQEAVDLCQTQGFDIIFMDCQMPVMDGLAASRLIRTTDNPNQHTPIIAVTANTLEFDDQVCRDFGINQYVAKPVKLDTLKNIIATFHQPNYPSINQPPEQSTAIN